MLLRSLGQSTVDHCLPFEERWAGWCVTGQHGLMRHRGNTDVDALFNSPPPTNTLNWSTFGSTFDAT
jgi:hypothetical protein